MKELQPYVSFRAWMLINIYTGCVKYHTLSRLRKDVWPLVLASTARDSRRFMVNAGWRVCPVHVEEKWQ